MVFGDAVHFPLVREKFRPNMVFSVGDENNIDIKARRRVTPKFSAL
jgi:hypothetical protein